MAPALLVSLPPDSTSAGLARQRLQLVGCAVAVIVEVALVVAGAPVSLQLTLHRGGLPRRISTMRWGDPEGYAVSHLGWGLHPRARWNCIEMFGPARCVAHGRAFAGNFLFSTGPNTQGGGTRTTRGHYDAPMRDCSVFLDGEQVIDRGKIIVEDMKA